MNKVIVDHTGSCGEYRYEAGVPVELPEEVIASLGDHAKPVDEETEKNIDEVPENKMVDGKKKKTTTK